MVSEFDLRFRSLGMILILSLNFFCFFHLFIRLDWSIKQIFDREIGNKCAIADSSTIIFERDRKVSRKLNFFPSNWILILFN